MHKNIRDKSKNYIKTLSILLGLSFVLAGLSIVSIRNTTALAAGINLSVSPATSTVVNGQTFTANIVLDTAGVNIDGVDVYSLHYNPAILQIQDANNSLAGVQITPGTLLPLTLANSVNASNGTVQFSQVTAGGSTFTGAGVLASISFKAILNGTSAVTIDFFPTGGIADSNVAGGGIDKLGSVTNASYTVAAAPTPSTKFSIGNTVQTTTTVNVRQTASATGTLLGTQTTGVQGTVVAGPTYADGFHWWQINYNTGADGWSAEDFLVKVIAPTPTPSQAPLVQLADFQKIGQFTLPKNLNQGDYRFGYGGTAPGYYKDNQGREILYMQGHDWYPGQVAQVQIPSSLSGTATLLQGFKDVADGKLGGLNGDKIGSMMVYNGRLIVSNYIYYDGSGSQQTTIGVSGLDLNLTSDFKGFYAASGTNQGRLGRYMTTIPTEWQSLLGGQALNGACCLSIIGRTNWGPGVSVFNPDDVGSGSVVPVKELSRYDDAHGLIYNGVEGECAQQSNVFNCVTTIAGVAFPAGTRSVLFFGTQGTGPVCYKDSGPTSCWGSGGYYAPPYYVQVWAFDANDFLAVKNC